jgi:putative surface-exposed virulence protein
LENQLGTAGIILKGTALAKNSFGHNGDSVSGHGLLINTNGSVSLNYVIANYNYGSGMEFPLTSAINVTIKNSDFNWNGLSGFGFSVLGTISLTNTNAFGNASLGALIGNPAASSPKSVTVKNGIFSVNNATGLHIASKGIVILSNITANSSTTSNGVYIDNTSGTAGVTFTGGDFDNNQDDGVNIRSNGAIKLTNITANSNWENGADLDNYSAPTGQPVTITGGDFSNSASIGLLVRTRGAINFTNIVSDSNGGDGAQLDNSTAVSAQPVTIKSGDFSHNAGMGLNVWTKGALNLASLSVDDNDLAGAYLDQSSADPLFPTATIMTGSFCSNGGQGLNLTSRGTIKVTNINASGNAGNGAYLSNKAGNVSVLASGASGGNYFNSNTTYDGLDIETLGTVTLNKVYASGNTGATGVFIYSTATNVTVNGGEFNNQSFGLYVPAKGTISVNNVVASGNTLQGITLMNNSDTTGAKNVIVSRICVKTNGNGLVVHTYGTITVNKIEALNNTGVGVYLDNTYGAFTTPKNISVLGSYGTSNIYKNTGTGLLIKTKGNVVISKMTANENVARAIDIDNFLGGLGKGTVSISYVTVNNNGQRGITISSNNNVILSSISALFNSLSTSFNAIHVETNNHNLTISNSLVSGNGYNGIVAYMGPAGVFKITNTYYFGNQGLYNIHLLH